MNYLHAVYEEIWNILVEYPEFRELVPEGNRIKWKGLLVPSHNTLGADHPQVRIIPRGMDMNIHASSCGTRVDVSYDIQALSGTTNLDKVMQLQWVLIRALQNMQEELSGRVVWDADDTTPIVRAEPTQTQESRDRDISQDTGGWHTVFRLEVGMFFQSSTLLIG